MILTFSGNIEAVDSGDRRTISGKIAPYGEVGNTSAGRVVFAKGSITAANPSKVKLLMSHDNSKVVGRMSSIQSGDDGLYASFKISQSSRGSDAILLAQEQLMDGLSVGVEVVTSKAEKDYLLVTSALLRKVSLVESPAFENATITKIAASESEAESENPTNESEAAPMEAVEPVTENPEVTAPPVVEAARAIIKPSVLDSQRVRHPIISMGAYTEHKIKAALGNDESKLYVTAADDAFSGAGVGFNPTQYLSEFVTNTRFGMPSIDACSRGTLPPYGLTINVPSLVTSDGGGSGTAPTVTVEPENGAVANTGAITEYLSGTISKYSGMNTVSIELLERGYGDGNFYSELTQQLENALITRLDTTVNAALVTFGTVATTAQAATSNGIIAYAAEAAQAIYKGTGYFASNYIANPAQWSLLLGAKDTTDRPLYSAANPYNAAGQVMPSSIKGNVIGLDLFVDKNFAVTTTADDSAIILAPEAFTVYMGPQAFMSVNVVANLQVQIAIYSYMATIGKMSKGVQRWNFT